MPGQDRLGRDEECGPTFLRDQTSEQGNERPVRPGEAGTGDLAAQDGELVSEDEDLGVLGHRVYPVHPDTLKHATDQAVEETERHGGRDWSDASSLVKAGVALLDPSGRRT